MAPWFQPLTVNGIMPRSAPAHGIVPVSLSTILVAGQRLAGKRLSKKCTGIKRAGHVSMEVTVAKRLSKVLPMLFTPKAQMIIASTMNLKRRHLILTGIHSVSRSPKKWVQLATES